MGKYQGRVAFQILKMCGIAGIISPDTSRIHRDVLSKMARALAHRGPDGETQWINQNNTTGLAHRRLSVIDRSEAASQPMHYLNRYTIVYNGEIYNYQELRHDLIKKGYKFYTVSDTEVILAAYAEYQQECVNYFDGMFSFAIWDNEEQLLFCARDRFGEKPFFYLYDEQIQSFYFASELKGLYAAGIARSDNHGLWLRYISLGYTTDPSDASQTFDARIKKLPASHHLWFSFKNPGIIIKRFWDIPTQVFHRPLKDAVEEFTDLFTTSVKRRLRSDVSLGISLSGGLDSSSIAATISSLYSSGLKTFTAAFPGFEKDESERATMISKKFGFENFTVSPDANGFLLDFEKLLRCQEEPFTSSSVYAQYKVFELAAREGVTVLLDGQGADETLAGYHRYLHWRRRTVFPKFTAGYLKRREERLLYSNPYINKDYIQAHAPGLEFRKPEMRQLNDLLYFDSFEHGLTELLRYADRNSMAHGREVRLPFLNHDLVSFVFSLPSSFKISHGYTKLVLRQAMKGKLPDEITLNTNKIGFEPPQQQWMEHSTVKNYAYEAIKILVNKGILTGKALLDKNSSHGAYDKNAGKWRWMIAGQLMLINKKGV